MMSIQFQKSLRYSTPYYLIWRTSKANKKIETPKLDQRHDLFSFIDNESNVKYINIGKQ